MWLALALLGLAAPSALADQTDARLPELFDRLAEAPGQGEAAAVEARIWLIWLESGRDDVDSLVESGIGAMSAGRLDEAIEAFDRAVELAPRFAEGFNKRATAYFLASRLAESVNDIQRTLALEPRHFGALSGMGLIFLRQGDERGALAAFEAVLEIYPASASARANVERLRRKIGTKRV
ncbi:MAG: tetratricopeptide repeat protein [Gammaproteobacteria bacterium]